MAEASNYDYLVSIGIDESNLLSMKKSITDTIEAALKLVTIGELNVTNKTINAFKTQISEKIDASGGLQINTLKAKKGNIEIQGLGKVLVNVKLVPSKD